MSRGVNKVLALMLVLGLLASTALPLPAQTAPPGGGDVSLAAGVWPREINVNGATVLVYEPQIDRWQNNRLEARAAVSLQPAGAPQLSYGVIWLTARTEVDKEHGIVDLEEIAIPKVNFPSAPPAAQERYLRAARTHLPAGVRTIPLEQFEADLAAARVGVKAPAQPVKNDPPRIIMSTVPALLVRIDGAPSLRQVQGSPLLRVINTPALILLDPSSGQYYLFASGRFLEAPALDAQWAPAAAPPASLEAARQSVMKAGPVDLLDTPAGQPIPNVVYISTVPTELIETSGPPTWSPIAGTELLYATNTKAHLFLELKTQLTYVLISGRWFRARSADGPWEYVPGRQLPPDFARIPEQSPAGLVLASIPGTPQSQEAVIANSIPQTATVNRSAAHFTATYDGSPKFVPITGTSLQYAVNSPTPIIRVDKRTYYSLYNAVWFVAAAPTGPWTVAISVPGVIYTIPVTSPVYYVTYVRIYGATPTVVYVGYTPGYLGTVVTPDGVVVYGTGVVYPAYVGTVWYPPPPTYGYGAGFAWGATTGFMMGAVAGAAMWGCCGCCSSTTTVNVNKTVTTVNSSSNVYNNWSKTTVSSGSKSATVYSGPNSKVVTNNQNNNVYATHDGNAYKKQDGQWEKWGGAGTGWQPVNTSGSSSTSSTSQNLGSSQSGEQRGQQSGTQQPGTQQSGTTQSRASQTSEQRGSQSPTGTQRQSGEGFGSPRQSGSGQTGGFGESSSRFGSEGGSSGQGFGRFGGSQGGGFGQGFGRFGGQGLEGESAARDRGFERFSGARGGFGGFRR